MLSSGKPATNPDTRHSWIGGATVVGTSGVTHDVVDPATGAVVCSGELAGAAEVDAAVTAAVAAFPGWSSATPADRSRRC
jgi:betaine-aldehyde dehydrogenase